MVGKRLLAVEYEPVLATHCIDAMFIAAIEMRGVSNVAGALDCFATWEAAPYDYLRLYEGDRT